ncbi:hypothetical protein [Parasitella parasitica]|uniref:Uncharacterized protein n=1 Tax=Parasitella parasitica TaxID=35722 RepID=A0A0B7NJF0_9FUNG|nr:hypothetical protein [Parasitella parasitica]
MSSQSRIRITQPVIYLNSYCLAQVSSAKSVAKSLLSSCCCVPETPVSVIQLADADGDFEIDEYMSTQILA